MQLLITQILSALLNYIFILDLTPSMDWTKATAKRGEFLGFDASYIKGLTVIKLAIVRPKYMLQSWECVAMAYS